MPMSMEQRLEVLKKAREAKAAKKKESSPMPEGEAVEKPADKPVKKPRAKKEQVKSLDLTQDLNEVKDDEINDILMPSKQEVEEIKKIKETGNPKKVKIEQEPEVEVEIVYEKAAKKKKKIVRKIIQEESSDDDDEPDVEIVYERKPKAKPKPIKQRAPPPPKDIPAPANPFFCY